jgi:hypothetical protein
MRFYILAALAATATASPMLALLPRQSVCVPPGVTADGLTGPFKIQVGDGSAFAGNYAGTIPKRVKFIVVQYSNPASVRVSEFYLDSSNNLLMIQNGVTSYAYNQVPPRYISLSTDPTVTGKITCTINEATCELNCQTANGLSTDCLGSTKLSPEWRIGSPAVVKPACPAFTPIVVADTTTTTAGSLDDINIQT